MERANQLREERKMNLGRAGAGQLSKPSGGFVILDLTFRVLTI